MMVLQCCRCGLNTDQTWSGRCVPCYRAEFGDSNPNPTQAVQPPVPLEERIAHLERRVAELERENARLARDAMFLRGV